MLNIKYIEFISPEPLNSAQTESISQVFAETMHSAWRAEGGRRSLTIDRLSVNVEQGAATQRGMVKQAALRTVAEIKATQRENER